MRKLFVILALFQFTVVIALSQPSMAQEWGFRAKPRGAITVVDLFVPSVSVMLNYAEALLTLDKDNNWIPCLAKDYRWIDDRTIEFKLREDVRFHNGDKFNAEAVRVNYKQYRAMETPRPGRFYVLPDETELEIIDDYTVRFILPESDAIAFVKFLWFFQFAPAFYNEHKFEENGYGYLPQPGPWGTGPFKLVHGGLGFAKPSERLVLEANPDYWDLQYPKVQRIIYDNTLIENREQAMKLCMEKEGMVDIVNYIRPLDTLRVAESPFAKVVKSRDPSALVGWFNQRKPDSKWRNIELRQAVNYAINRKELWKYAAKGNAYNLGGFIPAGVDGYSPDLTLYSYDTDKARSLLAEVGYADGFDMKIIAPEAWKLEAQIISKMLERIGLKAKLEVVTGPEWHKKAYIPYLQTSPEQQDWDITIWWQGDWFAHAGASFLTYGLLEDSRFRWIEFDPVFEEMWKDMARTLDKATQEQKIQNISRYVYERAYLLFIYSPLSLYAVNKEVNFVPQQLVFLRLKETSVTDNHWSLRGENQ